MGEYTTEQLRQKMLDKETPEFLKEPARKYQFPRTRGTAQESQEEDIEEPEQEPPSSDEESEEEHDTGFIDDLLPPSPPPPSQPSPQPTTSRGPPPRRPRGAREVDSLNIATPETTAKTTRSGKAVRFS